MGDKEEQTLEGQIYPAVSNIWNLAWQRGNVCLQAFMSSIVESLH